MKHPFSRFVILTGVTLEGFPPGWVTFKVIKEEKCLRKKMKEK